MMILFAAVVVYEYQKTPIPTEVSEAALQQSSTVYFSNGKTEVGTFSADGIDRQMLTSNQIPAVMKNAIVAAEDRNFYHEGGISVTGILRSAYEDLFGSGGLQGGSTLTEEFAKNYYTTIGTSPLGQHQDQGDLRRDQALAREVQGLDHDPVPEHGPVRRQRLRRRRGGADLLRRARR